MQVNPSFILRSIYDKNILIPFHTNNTSNDPILLNDVAATIWRLAPLSNNQIELLNNIAKTYNLNLDSVEIAAVDHFISQMITMGLLSE